MQPLFANPAGFWMLLGIPAILAIHFLQQRARPARTSTWFLIEQLAPDSARGRTWDRLRASRTLWLQLLAVLVAAWVLGEPRWVSAESAQTVVTVLDASASMDAFRAEAIAAADREMRLSESFAARTTWVVMSTDPRSPPLYRGTSREAATATLARWQPDLGQHDPGPALRLARGLAGPAGRTLFVTDTRAKVPPGQRAAGVGRPIENVGFAGASVLRDETGGHTWRALVKNHSATRQQRAWHLEVGAAASAVHALDLAPGEMTEISARLPDGTDAATVVLSSDAFAADDRLPLVRPAPKPLAVQVDGEDAAAQFLRRLAANVDGVAVTGPGGAKLPRPTRFRMAGLTPDELAQEAHAGVFWPVGQQRERAPLSTDPVTPERDPLVAGLNWQGWFGTGPHGFAAAPRDVPLLWQGRWPLVFVRPAAAPAANAKAPMPAGRKLLLAFDWEMSNASRLPATVLLVQRFLEAARDAQPAPYSGNFDCNAPVPLSGVPADGVLTLAWQPADGGAPESRAIAPAERGSARAPGRAAFFTIAREGETVVRGAAQFADPRVGDFREAERFFVSLPGERQAAVERNTRGDPFVPLWLLALAALMAGSWWTRVGMGGQPDSLETGGPTARAPT
jgi:hypothetical protein